MRRTSSIALTVVALAALAVAALRADNPVDPADTPLQRLMRSKLARAQQILEGAVTGDAELVARQAQALLALTQQAEWQALDKPRYLTISDEFRRILQRMIAHAQEKNLEGITLDYVQMTLSCANCHKVVRDAKRVDAGGDESFLAAVR